LVIGYWLGDGSSAYAEITTADPEIVDVFNEKIKHYGLELGPAREDITYYIRGINKSRKNSFLISLRQLNMLNNKHIPDLYKINSREVQLQILAGLIDSDGHVYNNGTTIEITQKNVRLSEDIEYLAFSLGFMITRIQCTKGCMYKGEMSYGVYERMNIFGEGLEEIPTILSRKKCFQRGQKKRATHQGLQIQSIGMGSYCKLQFATPGNLLLDDFLVI
jgi:intein/homing endonuclease